MRPVPLPPAFRLVAAAVLAAAGMSLSPARAAAGCGDYVTIEGRVDAGHPDEHGPSAAEPVAPRPPCYGPGCSDRPAAPQLPVTTPPGPPAPEGYADHPAAEPEGGRDPGWAAPLTPDGRRVRTASAIFHPPRAG
jgi:hypothetical protein